MADEDRSKGGPMERADRISKLPDEIREYILGFLSITNAVRTSVLSKRWRYSWTRAPHLNLVFDGRCDEKYMIKNAYCRLVGKVLLSHVGTVHKLFIGPVWHDLDEDELGFGDWPYRKGWSYLEEDMPTWLQFMSRKGVKDLTIHFKRGTSIGFVGPEDIEKFDPSFSIFHCVGLSYLSLENCNLSYSAAFKGFPNLVRLDLTEVDIDNDILERILSSCPLEILSIDWCDFISGRTPIIAPHLKVFKYARVHRESFPCYLKFTPNLKVASFKLDALDEEADFFNSNCFDIFKPIPSIEDFTFNCRLHKTSASDKIPIKFPELLGNLKTLTLDDFDASSIDHMSFMLCILRSSPHLQTLNVNMLHEFKPSPETSKDALKAATENLETMGKEEIKTGITTLSLVSGLPKYEERIRSEVAFIGKIVLCCPILKKLVIKAPLSVEHSVNLELLKAFKLYTQSSSQPEIVYLDAR